MCLGLEFFFRIVSRLCQGCVSKGSRVSRCVTSLYPGVFVCLPAFPLGGTSEVVKFVWGRVEGYDF